MVEQLGTDLGRILGPADSNTGSGPVAAVSPRYPAPETTSAETMDRSRSSQASDANSDFRRILDDRMRQDPSPASNAHGSEEPHDAGAVQDHSTSTQNERRSKTAKDIKTAGQADTAEAQAADQIAQHRATIQSATSTRARSTSAGTAVLSASHGTGAGSASVVSGPADASKSAISALKNGVADANSTGPHASKGDRNGVSKAGGSTSSGTKTAVPVTATAKSAGDTGRITAGAEHETHAVRAGRSATRSDSEATSTGRMLQGQTADQKAKTPGGSRTEASGVTREASGAIRVETANPTGRLSTTDRSAGAGESPEGRAGHGIAQGHQHRPSGRSDRATEGGRASKQSGVMGESIGPLDARKRGGSGGAGSIDTATGGPERTDPSAIDAGSTAADRITTAPDSPARTAGDRAPGPAAGPVMGRSVGPTASGAIHQQVADRILEAPVTAGRQIQITLTPPELGRVRMRFVETDGQIHGQLEVQNAQTRQEIERHISEVLAVLQNQGVQVRRIEVMPEPPAHQDAPPTGRDPADQGSLPFDEAPSDGGQSASGDGRRSPSQAPSDSTWNESAADGASQTQQYAEDRVNLYA